ncbi:LacI family DNA-binding transcriptional regulator [Diaminobutyricibacter sp. McL0618]|uniref:LacI family DNA-binding transcriptional regulator n=1 Tax=Leifsonia sp. McL0618 TaxID=3415677 RepID=UPI003CF6701A
MFTPQVVKAPTSSDVALAAGVSRATVSFVLNDKPNSRISDHTRHRVLEAARLLGYTPNTAARSLASGELASGFLIPQPARDYGASVDRAFDLVLTETADDGTDAVWYRDREQSGVDAAHAWAKYRPESVLAEAERCDEVATEVLRLAGVRALIVYGSASVDYAPSLAVPQEPFGRLAAEHLLALGHRRLTFLLPTADRALVSARERLRGAADAVNAAGATLTIANAGDTASSLRDWAHGWQYSPAAATGIIASDDRLAMGAIRALTDAGVRVPADASVIGADDHPPAAEFIPRVTTVAFPSAVLAESLLDAFARMRAGTRVDRVRLPELAVIRRESTAPAAAA